ncbi:Lysophospholipase VolA [Granulosicoccus antarcticus IMCC3135]|uniref:Lysophospholipase VolA n=2 Tax=Granulosicoccus TaxID=437504 RepID=A0A2Z2P0P3_9GAMM|nr:Lysophospholipase VolA [Granulosicoccus antarcticus IMCC3135]
MNMYRKSPLIAAPLLITLAACSSDSNYDFEGSKDILDAQIAATSAPQALFSPDPDAPVLPFPNSLFFVGSTDGTLSLPVAETDVQTLANPRVALNQADGFSTIAPIVTTVSEPLDPETLILGDTVRVYEVTTTQAIAVTSIVAEIDNPLLMAVRSIGNQLVLIPTVPLKPKTDYMVVLTNGITDVDGQPLTASLVYGLLKGDQELTNPATLEALRGATATQVGQAQAVSGIEPDDIALSWVFKTQSIREVLQAAKDQTVASPLVLASSGLNTAAEAIGLQGKADVYIGTLDVPYYLTGLTENLDSEEAGTDAEEEERSSDAVLNSFWHNSGGNVVGAVNESGAPDYAPVTTGTETIPVLMSVPNEGEMPADGWPVTIYQHGITRSRTDMLAIADAMADAGRVVIAIDMPMHGLIDTTSPLHADNTPFGERERTFGIDLMVNPLAEDETADADAPTEGPDGKADPSGQYYINLQNLANSRDNLRQSVADLFALRASLGGASIEGLQLDPNNLNFVGHSLGGIVGTTMLSYDDSFHSASLAMPGGGIAQLLANSESLSGRINDGLAAAGIPTGSDEYNSFLTVAQTLLDSADPVNHATTLAQAGRPQVHLMEVIGDLVIPNNVATAPLSGTDPLARLLGLTQVAETSSTGGLVKFSAGDHGSIISPEASLATTIEMQTQVATFAASQGTVLPITNSDVIAPLP